MLSLGHVIISHHCHRIYHSVMNDVFSQPDHFLASNL
jgi:hypothetical protein